MNFRGETTIVYFGQPTYAWLLSFEYLLGAIKSPIASLLQQPRFADSFIGPVGQKVHGQYLLFALHVNNYIRLDVELAHRAIDRWIDERAAKSSTIEGDYSVVADYFTNSHTAWLLRPALEEERHERWWVLDGYIDLVLLAKDGTLRNLVGAAD